MTLKQLLNLLTGLTALFFIACGRAPINKTAGMDSAQFEAFKHKGKINSNERLHYPGIGDPKMKSILTGKINQPADDLIGLSATGTTDKAYHDAIKKA